MRSNADSLQSAARAPEPCRRSCAAHPEGLIGSIIEKDNSVLIELKDAGHIDVAEQSTLDSAPSWTTTWGTP